MMRSIERSLRSITTSDMEGREEAGVWVHIKASSMIFFAASSVYPSETNKISSTSFECKSFSYSFHACLKATIQDSGAGKWVCSCSLCNKFCKHICPCKTCFLSNRLHVFLSQTTKIDDITEKQAVHRHIPKWITCSRRYSETGSSSTVLVSPHFRPLMISRTTMPKL